ncbi:gas vesicle protein [Streptomyces seoulensis]|uniref:gas vesicle protein GvpO n=1 Tax=Streptomyces seoulensis TaxID=73044 RepID=UPI0020490E61|nr:gas vesicle protein [Streptomyces seoulensis]BDH06326.1 gas vesicle protein [Streptomyces seoulensis]
MDRTDSDNAKGGQGPEERMDLPTVMRQASAQLSGLLQREVGAVSAVKAIENGWAADVEVVEVEKVPDTMSVMASYRVELDQQGRIMAYERVRRYARGQIDRR